MTRKSRREIERAIEDLTDDANSQNQCSECGGLLSEADESLGVNADYVTYECTCDDADPVGEVICSFEQPDDYEPDPNATVVDFTEVDT